MIQLTEDEYQWIEQHMAIHKTKDGTILIGTQRMRSFLSSRREIRRRNKELVMRLEFAKNLAIKQEARLKPFYLKVA